jgi:hypothetical protein
MAAWLGWRSQLGPGHPQDHFDVACCGSTEDTMRMLGGEILGRFTVFRLSAQQMFLVPNRFYTGPSN